MESLLERLVVEIADEPDETVDDPFVSSSDEESSGSAWFGPSWGQRCFGIVGYSEFQRFGNEQSIRCGLRLTIVQKVESCYCFQVECI